MKNTNKFTKSLAIGALTLAAVVGATYAANTTLNMQIIPGTVSIGSPTSFSFSSTLSASDVTQSLEQAFSTASDYFYIQDLKGADAGYSTTLQVSGPLTAGSNTIPAANISFKSTGTTPTLLSGSANTRVVLDNGTSAYQAFSSARTFMLRSTAANSGTIGKYGAQVSLKVDVPAWQAVGTYTTNLVFTLIES